MKPSTHRSLPLLAVKDLTVSLGTRQGRSKVLHGVSFSLARGNCFSLVGESGCGKTVTALSIMGLLPSPGGRIDSGHIFFKGQDLVNTKEKHLRSLRGHKVAMIFQDPHSAMNPYLRVSEQLIEGLIHHKKMPEREALEKALTLLEKVGIPESRKRIHDYPHSFSGGMLQRIMIAMALMTTPDLIIADEPTSALDVTIQAQTLKLLDELRKSIHMSMLLITHDLGVVAGRSDRLGVMYAGHIVEYGSTEKILKSPIHPYMKALLKANPSFTREKVPRLDEIRGQPPSITEAMDGCSFAPRCHHSMDPCLQKVPPFLEIEEDHRVACWLLG